jgi:YVTN family beta-propeller protein
MIAEKKRGFFYGIWWMLRLLPGHRQTMVVFKTTMVLGAALLAAPGCGSDPAPEPTGFRLEQGAGVLVLNEGQFGNGNASLSYFDFNTEEVTSTLFQTINQRPLGDVLQSGYLAQDQLWLVVNASATVEAVALPGLEGSQTIGGLVAPRFFLPLSNQKAYVSDLYANAIFDVNPTTGQVTDTIPMPGWTEEMVLANGRVFVSMPWLFSGAPSNTIQVINPATNQMVNTITVGVDPGAMALDGNGQLWVFCKGNPAANDPAGLYRIDPVSGTVAAQFDFTDYDIAFAPRLAISPDGTTLYYLKDAIYAMSITATALPAAPLIAQAQRNLYALAVHPQDGHLFVGDAVDFQQQGQVYEYDTDGQLVRSFLAGVGPNGFLFY